MRHDAMGEMADRTTSSNIYMNKAARNRNNTSPHRMQITLIKRALKQNAYLYSQSIYTAESLRQVRINRIELGRLLLHHIYKNRHIMRDTRRVTLFYTFAYIRLYAWRAVDGATPATPEGRSRGGDLCATAECRAHE